MNLKKTPVLKHSYNFLKNISIIKNLFPLATIITYNATHCL